MFHQFAKTKLGTFNAALEPAVRALAMPFLQVIQAGRRRPFILIQIKVGDGVSFCIRITKKSERCMHAAIYGVGGF
jgi:hypothetical protein